MTTLHDDSPTSIRPPKKRVIYPNPLALRSRPHEGISGISTATEPMSTSHAPRTKGKTTTRNDTFIPARSTEMAEQLDLDALTYYPAESSRDPRARHVDTTSYILVPDSLPPKRRVDNRKQTHTGGPVHPDKNNETFESEAVSTVLVKPRRKRRRIVVSDNEDA